MKRATRALEAQLIRAALERTGGNRTRAAELLEISYRALLYKIKEYGIALIAGSARPAGSVSASISYHSITLSHRSPTPTDISQPAFLIPPEGDRLAWPACLLDPATERRQRPDAIRARAQQRAAAPRGAAAHEGRARAEGRRLALTVARIESGLDCRDGHAAQDHHRARAHADRSLQGVRLGRGRGGRV